MLELDSTALTIVLVASWFAGVSKVAFGIGSGVFLTPVLALMLPPKVAVGLMAPLMIITDVLALQAHWRKWHARHLAVLLPTAFVGVVIGALYLAWAPSTLVRKTIGAVALLYVAVQLFYFGRGSRKFDAPMPVWGGSVIGLFTGITTSVAHSGGVVMSIYLLTVGLAKNTFVATVVAVFFATNLLKFPLYWQTGVLNMPILLTGIALTPLMLLGGRMGISLNRRLTAQQFTTGIVVIVGLAGVILLASS